MSAAIRMSDPRDPCPADVLTDVDDFTCRGLPRRRLPAPGGASTPIPWVNGAWPVTGVWTRFDNERMRLADAERRCFVCGDVMAGPIFYVRYFALSSERVAMTDGPGCHAGCALIALRSCPSLREDHGGRRDEVVAYRYDGEGLGSVTLAHVAEHTGVPLPADMPNIKTARMVLRPYEPVTLVDLSAAARRARGRGR